MDSFFIGPPEKQIFATYLPARDSENTKGGVLLCYPFGQEYLRAHRAFRQLATMLSRSGFHVLRFDYPGSGDSFGDAPVESFSAMVDQVLPVVSVLQERCGAKPLYICGLRFGALFAASLAARVNAFNGLVLWDPYSSGSDFVEDSLSQVQQSETPATEAGWQVHGFTLVSSFREDIKQFDLGTCELPGDSQLSLVLSHENAYSNRVEKILSNRKQSVRRKLIPSNGNWNYVDRDGSILIPSSLIREIPRLLENMV